MASVYERFATIQDLQNKLGGVVASYKGEWIWISLISATGRAEYYPIIDQGSPEFAVKQMELMKVPEEDLNYKDYKLGFCNVRNNLFYVSRFPLRKYKFGLRDDNLEFAAVPGINKEEAVARGRRNPDFNAAIQTGALDRCLRGKYLSFPEAVKSVKSGIVAEPFHREFALVRSALRVAQIYYKTDPIGEVDLRDSRIDLYQSSDHMFERLQRLGIGDIHKYKE